METVDIDIQAGKKPRKDEGIHQTDDSVSYRAIEIDNKPPAGRQETQNQALPHRLKDELIQLIPRYNSQPI